ncbi:hypothetical protein ONZ45_g4519 [Pleurotus djamor]|nr:hypothetical protein ONZ45_g4519 [Pleurotus djamor]
MYIGSPTMSEPLSNFGPSPSSSVSDEASLLSGSRPSSELSPILPSIHQTYMAAHPVGPPYPVTSPGPVDNGFNGLPKNKAANYKTKLCRFFKPDRPCPNGETCTFIHATYAEGKIKQVVPPKSPTIPLPSKPISSLEAHHQKGFYPVGWRVIGGGVPLSQENSSSSESTASSYDSLESWEGELLPPGSHQVSASLSRRNKNSTTPLKIDVAGLPPVAFRQQGQVGDVASTPTRTMTPKLRPTSTPPTPSATHVNIMSLFNAESPAIL